MRMTSSSRLRLAPDVREDDSLRPSLGPKKNLNNGTDDSDSDDDNATVTEIYEYTGPKRNVSSNNTGSEGEQVPKEENQITDDAIEETAVVGPKDSTSTSSLEPNSKGRGENHQASTQDEAHDEVQGHSGGSVGSAFRKKMRQRIGREMSAGQGTDSSTAMKKESISSVRASGRGRPSKSDAVSNGTRESMLSSSKIEGSEGRQKRAPDGSELRRSSRAAAEFATQQITEQTKRPKLVETPSPAPATDQKKGIATPGGKGRGRPTRTLTKTLAKTPTKPEYEVELILDTRKKSGATEYLVKWKGYHVKESTWEPAANLTHCAQALKEFRSGGSRK
ncbi:hypothetical protein O1611_g8242 [Lasiodiplodia mahajangana]|uniref:Uncharacterized protein n=1 Tax=Lasiodiplodia mahajangana TaxID=1108764 RepID=A0ACC2JDW6_9PEZI|nr:hypothetical protein O1611_g8242 [Lasiodiplodia mahajangana]